MYEYQATITKVYDGDSVTCDIDLGLNTFLRNQKLRLYGIDTPELRDVASRQMALDAKQRLSDLCLSQTVIIKTHKDRTGKYGRWLVTIFVDSVDVNQLLIQEGFAKPYGT